MMDWIEQFSEVHQRTIEALGVLATFGATFASLVVALISSYLSAGRHPAASASCREQNHCLPGFVMSMRE